MAYFWQFLFVILILETALFAFLASQFGFSKMTGLLVLSAAAGSAIAARQGREALASLQSTLQRKGKIAAPAIAALCTLVSGLLFVFPGFLTDLMAILLFFPVVRRILAGKFGAAPAPFTPAPYSDNGDVEGIWSRVDDGDVPPAKDASIEHRKSDKGL